MKQLILGGARSGKSALAEQLARQSGQPVTYIATATAEDDEMHRRIQHHQQQRAGHWQLIEEPLRLSETLQQHAAKDRCLLVDCLSLWLSNHLCADHDLTLLSHHLVDSVERLPGEIIFVSNEVGLGVVPTGELSRRFVDEAGRLHQSLAKVCDRVIFTMAGLPQVLKGTPL